MPHSLQKKAVFCFVAIVIMLLEAKVHNFWQMVLKIHLPDKTAAPAERLALDEEKSFLFFLGRLNYHAINSQNGFWRCGVV